MLHSHVKISLVINTKNEEKRIEKCIISAKKLVDEIVVADMKSTDKTVSIAKKLGAKICEVKDYGYVEPVRNIAIQRATGDWILILDADERMTFSLIRTLKKLSTNRNIDVVKLPRKNFILGRWIKHTAWWPDYQVRFFRKGHVRWSPLIHSSPTTTGKTKQLSPKEKNAIVHYNIATVDEFLAKINIYTSHTKKIELAEDARLEKLVAYWENEFTYRFVEKEGYKDGLHGLFLSKLMEFYRLVEIMKKWEKNDFTQLITKKELNTYAQSFKKTAEPVEKPKLSHNENNTFNKIISFLRT